MTPLGSPITKPADFWHCRQILGYLGNILAKLEHDILENKQVTEETWSNINWKSMENMEFHE